MSTLKPSNDEPLSSESEPVEDDEYYIKCMSEILDAFPKSGPPGHPTRLSDHLYIGNQDNADDTQLLSALDITHVLNMAGTRTFDFTRSPYKPESGIRSFLMLPTEDFEEYDMLPHLLEAIAFLSRAASSGGCAFVHCSYGVNRSGIVAAAYLMLSEQKPLLRVINELKAKRALVLSNVGFRRQLVKFARCRKLLDTVERQSRRSPGDRSPRAVTPCKDKDKDEQKDESSESRCAETGEVKKAAGNGSEVGLPLKNGLHVSHAPEVTISTDLEVNALMTKVRRRHTTAHRERLLRDVDNTIETLSARDDGSIDRTPSPNVFLYEQLRTSLPIAHNGFTDPSSHVVPNVFSQLEVSSPHQYSSDSDEGYSPSLYVADSLRSSSERTFNPILDEYARYKAGSTWGRLPAATGTGEPYISRSHYSRSAATSSVLDDYAEADISSYLADRNVRRVLPPSRGRTDFTADRSAGLDPRRRSATSVEAILSSSRPYSSALPASAYTGRWYPTSAASSTSRRYYPTSYDSDYELPVSGHIGRTIATRVTPAPGYGPYSSYARSYSVSRLQ